VSSSRRSGAALRSLSVSSYLSDGSVSAVEEYERIRYPARCRVLPGTQLGRHLVFDGDEQRLWMLLEVVNVLIEVARVSAQSSQPIGPVLPCREPDLVNLDPRTLAANAHVLVVTLLHQSPQFLQLQLSVPPPPSSPSTFVVRPRRRT
jgi:hypothetical protein